MSVLKFNEENFEKEVIESNQTVLVDFYADWCGPCKMMSPVIDKIAEMGDKVNVGKVNTDENMNLAERFNIMSIPTIIVFKEGKIHRIFNGVTDKNEIINAIN